MLEKNENLAEVEHKVSAILGNDGVDIIDVDNTKTPVLTSLAKLKTEFPEGKSWAKRVINTFNSAFFNSATLISQNKGQGCRRHKHLDCDEFWVILSGKMMVQSGEDRKEFVVSPGDIVYFKKGTFHKITVLSDEPGVRLSVSVEEMENIYCE